MRLHKTVNIRIHGHDRDWLKEHAKKLNIPLSTLVRLCIRDTKEIRRDDRPRRPFDKQITVDLTKETYDHAVYYADYHNMPLAHWLRMCIVGCDRIKL